MLFGRRVVVEIDMNVEKCSFDALVESATNQIRIGNQFGDAGNFGDKVAKFFAGSQVKELLNHRRKIVAQCKLFLLMDVGRSLPALDIRTWISLIDLLGKVRRQKVIDDNILELTAG